MDYDKLGFDVGVSEQSYKDTVSRLDNIIKRLERIQQLEGKGVSGGSNNVSDKGNTSGKAKLTDEERWEKQYTDKIRKEAYYLKKGYKQQEDIISDHTKWLLQEAKKAEKEKFLIEQGLKSPKLTEEEQFKNSFEKSKRRREFGIQEGYIQENQVLSDTEKYLKKVNNEKDKLNDKTYEEARRIELANQQRKKEIDQRLKQELGIKQNTKSLTSYIAKLTSVVMLARKFAHFMGDAIQESAKYIENLNLFAVAYGKSYERQLDWALEIAEAYGLANNEVVKFAGTFRELSTSLGLVGDTADLVSRTVTNLGYDLSALFNTTVEQAMEKLQSGVFSGNVRPLRAYGIDISQNQIDALFETNEALKQLGVNARNLSQSDKVLARLIITLQSGKDSFGTMAREINNLQSQFRIFQGSLANFKLAIGDLFNKPLAEAMVYVNGFIIGITNVIRAFVPLQKEDTTPKIITNIAEGSEEASKSIDELQGKLAGFDKFNVLQQGGGEGSNLAVTEALNKLLEEQATLYQSQLGDLTNINNKATQIATSVESFFKPLLPYLEFVSNTVKDIVNLIYPIVENVLVKLKPLLEPLVKIWGDSYKLIDNILVLLSPIINMVLDLLNISTPLLEIVHSITWVISTALSGALYGIIGILTPILFVFETIFKVVESIAEIVRSLFQWDWNSLGKNLSNIWKTWRVGELTNALANFNPIPKFANGGYSNANLIMTHENGKREWVGKAAGSSAIVNDTQMSDIMEGAVAKGVFSAMKANSAMGSTTPTNENIIIKIGEEEVFRAVRKTAKRKGVDFASV